MMTHQLFWAVLLAGSVAAPLGVVAGSPTKSLSICELFTDLPRYNGKVVTVTGPIIRQPYYAIGQVDCPHRFVTKGYAWPSMVMLASTTEAEFDGARVAFSTDQASLDALDTAVREATRDSEIWITVTGELKLKKHYHAVYTHYGVLGDGFGHLGASPALLVIKTVDRVEVKHAPI